MCLNVDLLLSVCLVFVLILGLLMFWFCVCVRFDYYLLLCAVFACRALIVVLICVCFEYCLICFSLLNRFQTIGEKKSNCEEVNQTACDEVFWITTNCFSSNGTPNLIHT